MKIKEPKVSSGGMTKRFFAGLLLSLCTCLGCKSSSATTGNDGVNSLLSEKSYAQIPAGNFLMGLPGVKLEERERPRHKVLISRGFEIGRYEVTQAQWESVMGSNPSAFKGRELPVTNISWNDVQDFLKSLQSHDDQHIYRLPTEAEWEYACRAGSTGNFSGEDFLIEKPEETSPKKNRKSKKEPVGSTVKTVPGKENLDDVEKNLKEIGWYAVTALNRPHAVGKLKPNAWGIYDMHGNVWEWCQDWFDEKYYKVSPAQDPQGPPKGAAKVTRGGSWQVSAYLCRATVRGYDPPNERNTVIGFRLVRVKKGAEMK